MVHICKTKFSLHGLPRYSEKCLFDWGIDYAKLGPILTKKSLNPSAISNEPESILSLLSNLCGMLLTPFFHPRTSLIVCHVFFESLLYSLNLSL